MPKTPTKRHRIPPDPEKENWNRSDWADVAITAFQNETGTGNGDAICDLLCDIAHFCDRNREEYGTFADALRRAINHYDPETNGKGKQFNGISIDEAETL